MKFKSNIIKQKTKKMLDILDLTDKVLKFVEKSGIKNGLVNIQTLHTTAMVILNENEPLLLKDIQKNLERLASTEDDYDHDNFDIRTVNMCEDECENGHSHCKAVYLTPNVVVNLIKGRLQLGQWQRILFIELDRSRSREVQVAIMGE
jgi:secondary thiamine-phosphate synthase enzyme